MQLAFEKLRFSAVRPPDVEELAGVVWLVCARSAFAVYGGGVMRGGTAVGVFALFLLLVGGCTGNDEPSEAEGEVRLSAAGDPAPQPLGDAVTLDGESASLDQDEVSVEVPSGAVASEATLQFGQSLGTVDGEVFGRPVSVEVTEPLERPLELRWNIAEVTEQQRASIVPLRWDDDLEVWAVDEHGDTQLRFEDDELVIVTSEFSWRSWSWAADFGQSVGERTGSRRSGPSCDGELPSWVTNVVDPGDGTSAAAIQVCFEPDGEDTVTVRVVNNRPFTQRLEMTEGGQHWAWTWPGEESYDVSAAVNVAARAVFDSDTAFLLPPLSETAVGVSRPEGGGSHFIAATAITDHNTFLIDGVDYLLGLLTPGGFDDPLLNEFVALVYECGGSAALSGTDFTRVSTAIVEVLASCVSEVMTSSSDYGARFDAARIDAIAAASPARQAELVKMNRSLHQLASAAHLLKAGELAFYFTDQLQNAYVGDLTLSLSATGRPGELGEWTASCDDLASDSNRLFRNLTLRDPFYDTSRELWEFDELEPAAEQAVQPLKNCDNEYLGQLAALLPDDWADGRAANMVSGKLQTQFLGQPIQVTEDGIQGAPSGDELVLWLIEQLGVPADDTGWQACIYSDTDERLLRWDALAVVLGRAWDGIALRGIQMDLGESNPNVVLPDGFFAGLTWGELTDRGAEWFPAPSHWYLPDDTFSGWVHSTADDGDPHPSDQVATVIVGGFGVFQGPC